MRHALTSTAILLLGRSDDPRTPNSPKTCYGMPAYARDGKVVCFFQSGQRFDTRYATLGFSDTATLDEGAQWLVAYALKELTVVEEARVISLLKQAVP